MNLSVPSWVYVMSEKAGFCLYWDNSPEDNLTKTRSAKIQEMKRENKRKIIENFTIYTIVNLLSLPAMAFTYTSK